MALSDLNERLNEAALRRDALLRARSRYDALEAGLAEARSRLEAQERILQKEQHEYERLEGRSVQALFYSILGSRERQLEKERQEYLAALLKRDEARARIAALEGDRETLLREARRWAGAEDAYRALLAEKEQLLLAAGDEQSRRLQAVNDRLRTLAGEVRELQEAEAAGGPALLALRDVARHLRNASGWGTWDLLGGDTLATWAKHDHIDAARAALYRAQHALQVFRNELSDLGRRVEWALDLDGLTTFADFFFDNLLTDWIVQQRIRRSLEATEELGGRVEQLVADLGRRRLRLGADVQAAAGEKAALLAH